MCSLSPVVISHRKPFGGSLGVRGMSSSIYWQGSGPGLIEDSNRPALESHVCVPLEASILNIMCEGRKWLSNGYIYREFGVDFGYKIPR